MTAATRRRSRFTDLVDRYAPEAHGAYFGESDIYEYWRLDASQPYVLLELNVRGGYWMTTGASIEELLDNHFEQEYAGDWQFHALFETKTGKEIKVRVTRVYEVLP